MKRETLFLKIAVILLGIPALALCLFGLPWLVNNPFNSEYALILYPITTGIYISILPYYIALYHAFTLLNFIDKNIAFSDLSVKALKSIKYCAFTISIIYVILIPLVYMVAEKDDAPGLIIMGMAPIFASMVIAFFAAILQKLLKEAIDIKSDNDLTI
jgi:hypothetical protein